MKTRTEKPFYILEEDTQGITMFSPYWMDTPDSCEKGFVVVYKGIYNYSEKKKNKSELMCLYIYEAKHKEVHGGNQEKFVKSPLSFFIFGKKDLPERRIINTSIGKYNHKERIREIHLSGVGPCHYFNVSEELLNCVDSCSMSSDHLHFVGGPEFIEQIFDSFKEYINNHIQSSYEEKLIAIFAW